MKQKGYTLAGVEKKIATLFSLATDDLHVKTREKRIVDARSVLCYFAVISSTAMARHLNMTQPAITYAVKRGKIYAEENCYALR